MGRTRIPCNPPVFWDWGFACRCRTPGSSLAVAMPAAGGLDGITLVQYIFLVSSPGMC